jgi:hypothetical protein
MRDEGLDREMDLFLAKEGTFCQGIVIEDKEESQTKKRATALW